MFDSEKPLTLLQGMGGFCHIQAQAVADKEREMNTLLRETDKENARFQVKLEALQSRLEELTASRVTTKELESKY